MENITVLANQEKKPEEEQEMNIDDFDAIERADADDEAAFRISAPAGANLDS